MFGNSYLEYSSTLKLSLPAFPIVLAFLVDEEITSFSINLVYKSKNLRLAMDRLLSKEHHGINCDKIF